MAACEARVKLALRGTLVELAVAPSERGSGVHTPRSADVVKYRGTCTWSYIPGVKCDFQGSRGTRAGRASKYFESGVYYFVRLYTRSRVSSLYQS